MIEFRHVSKTFSRKGNEFLALDNIDLKVEQGDIFGIIGYSGAGKSTLLRLINNLETPTQGEVIVNGKALQEFSKSQLNTVKKNIGMIFQNFNLLNAKTVYHNVAIPLILQGRDKAFIQARVKELLAFVNLSEKIHSYPDELSGGQKQRVGIARALATNPSILLCDEATSALDPHTTVQILLLLKEINLRYGITIVLITHEMSVIQKICNKMAVIEQGRVVEQGEVLSLFAHPQHPVTASFVQTVIHDRLPEKVVQSLRDSDSGALLRLEFLGTTARQPLITEVIKAYDLEVNILFASMSEVQETILGFMIVQLRGERSQTEAAIGFLSSAGVKISHV
ncbi:ATP-binding cassette domain-containing protein [Erwiniaceae bacterium BAC15a-03b]|uniref:Cell division ATP-binding protein FtsE n=1 Tax=Winslowiella arboricola TaxID=2978220 RepID=A0A9J6PMZ7_9GAMM|nr:ATP-binding cassette domain-containing protein [Winslowiella arboricola]MCU5771675.1 ATP-binding cassette domain-containing protein [Winslowiella arboricola]MCU5778150.1 ATP-binding cassette domain-containing protein [Winslowiella arboricola]